MSLFGFFIDSRGAVAAGIFGFHVLSLHPLFFVRCSLLARARARRRRFLELLRYHHNGRYYVTEKEHEEHNAENRHVPRRLGMIYQTGEHVSVVQLEEVAYEEEG